MNRTNEQLTNEALTRHGRLEICDKHPRGAVFVPATSGLQSGGLPNELTTHGLFPSVFNLIPTGLHTPIRTPIAIWFNPESVVMVVMTSETSHIAQYSVDVLGYLFARSLGDSFIWCGVNIFSSTECAQLQAIFPRTVFQYHDVMVTCTEVGEEIWPTKRSFIARKHPEQKNNNSIRDIYPPMCVNTAYARKIWVGFPHSVA